jgi:hypothetical protein
LIHPCRRLYPALTGDQGREAVYGRIRDMGTSGRVMRLVGLAFVIALGLCSSASATPLSYTFDSDNQGWMQNQNPGSSDFVPAGWAGTDGNPGGHLTAKDTGPENGCQTGGTCQLLTFYSPVFTPLSANYGGLASFDLRSADVDPAFPAELWLLAAGNNYLDGVLPDPTGMTYHHLSIPLTETANWSVCPYGGGTCTPPTQAEFKSLIGATDQIAVMVDVSPNGTNENYDLDNVNLTNGPATPVTSPRKCKKKKRHAAATAKKKKCKKKGRRHRAAVVRG